MIKNPRLASFHLLARQFQNRLAWKLLTSYLAVILVGVITLIAAAQIIVPAAFSRHVREMEHAMHTAGVQSDLAQMEADLFANFQSAFNEVLAVAAVSSVLGAVFAGYFISRRVVTPIQQITKASGYIANGHYSERVEATGNDELAQLATSFNRMATRLDQTETIRRDLIADVAHELRTPLTGIKGLMEGLIDGVIPAEADTYQQVYREADRLQRLVNDLQELSRVEANAVQLIRRPLNLLALIRQITIRLLPQFEEKGVLLTLNLPAVLPAVSADEDRISQVLLNLIGNALQYTPSGGNVTVSADYRHRRVEVSVADTGIGIPAEHLPHLFTRFYRVDKSRSRAGGGNGIGLTIARHLIEAHGGTIEAVSGGANQGSVFRFSLLPAGSGETLP